MSYLFTCQHCQTKTLVEDRYSGQSGNCVTCGSAITLPDFAPQAAVETSPVGNAAAIRQGDRGWSPQTRRAIAATIGLILLGITSVSIVRFGVPAVSSLQANRWRASSIRDLEQVAAALNAYASDYGTYPPPAIYGADGTPLHSWRVLILPYLGENELFDRYDFNEPWNSAGNRRLIGQPPALLRSGEVATASRFYLITGPGTLFPPALPHGFAPRGPRDVSDNPGQTLLVVEAVPPAAAMLSGWTEPIDLDVSLMRGAIGSSPGVEIGGVSEDGAVVATVDGRGHFIDQRLSPVTVMALTTIAGGEPIADDIFDR